MTKMQFDLGLDHTTNKQMNENKVDFRSLKLLIKMMIKHKSSK
jgi:hypothetical protein